MSKTIIYLQEIENTIYETSKEDYGVDPILDKDREFCIGQGVYASMSFERVGEYKGTFVNFYTEDREFVFTMFKWQNNPNVQYRVQKDLGYHYVYSLESFSNFLSVIDIEEEEVLLVLENIKKYY